MVVEHTRVEAGVLLGSECVALATDRIDGPGDLGRRPPLGPLEQKVLDEVRDAVLFRCLVPGTLLEPDAQRHGAQGRHLFGENGEPVRENFLAMHDRRCLCGELRVARPPPEPRKKPDYTTAVSYTHL